MQGLFHRCQQTGYVARENATDDPEAIIVAQLARIDDKALVGETAVKGFELEQGIGWITIGGNNESPVTPPEGIPGTPFLACLSRGFHG